MARVGRSRLLALLAVSALPSGVAAVGFAARRSLALPEARFADLLIAAPSAIGLVRAALVEYGAFALVDVPGLQVATAQALGALPACTHEQHPAIDGEALPAGVRGDRSFRATVAARTTAGVAGEVTIDACAPSLEPLRAVVGASTAAIASAIGASFGEAMARGGGGAALGFAALASEGEQLEHFHLYPVPNASALAGVPDEWTLPVHTDAGLLAVMTAGAYLPAHLPARHRPGRLPAHLPSDMPSEPHAAPARPLPPSDGGLFLKLRSGELVRVAQAAADAPRPSLLVFAGEGAASWLRGANGSASAIRAAPHALRVGTAPSGSAPLARGWHGRMLLPPADALLPSGVPFAEHWLAEARALAGQAPAAAARSAPPTCAAHGALPRLDALERDRLAPPARAAAASAAAASAAAASAAAASAAAASAAAASAAAASAAPPRRRRLASAGGDGACVTSGGQAGVECWMVCMDASALPCAPAQARCFDKVTGRDADGADHCPSSPVESSCDLRCDAAGAGVDAPPDAAAAGRSAFCDGGGTAMNMQGFQSALFPPAAQAAAGVRARAACVNLFLREWRLDSAGKFAAGCLGVVALGIGVEIVGLLRARALRACARSKLARLAVTVATCALQLFIGYLLMLAAMAYNAELFVSVLCGLVLGHALARFAGAAGASEADAGGEVDPCCPKSERELLAPVERGAGASDKFATDVLVAEAAQHKCV